MMLCPQENPRRRPHHQADRTGCAMITSEVARGLLESIWDDAATGEADPEVAAAQEAATRLARIQCVHAARRLPVGDPRRAVLVQEVRELGEVADEFHQAAAWI